MSTKGRLKFETNFKNTLFQLHGRPVVENVLTYFLRTDAKIKGGISFEYEGNDSYLVFEDLNELLFFKLYQIPDNIQELINFK